MKKTVVLIIAGAAILFAVYVLSDPYFFTSAETLYEIGVAKSDEGNDAINRDELEEAAKFFERAIAKGYRKREVYVKLSRAYSFTADNATKEEMLTTALKEHPNDVEFLFRRAESRIEQHKYRLALEDYDKVVKSDSVFEYKDWAIYGRGAAFYLLGDTAKAALNYNLLTRLTGNKWRDYEDYAYKLKHQ